MVSDRAGVEITTKHRKVVVDAEQADLILDTRILRLKDVRGFYGRPFIYYNRTQKVHHRFKGPYDAFRSTFYKRDWLGQGNDIPDGEKQRLLQYLQEHQFLLVWVAAGLLSKQERERFERTCRKMARQMGKPINEIKVKILMGILFAPETEGAETVKLLKSNVDLIHERLKEAARIAGAVNWHALILLREITRQREVLEAAHVQLKDLRADHIRLLGDYRREDHFNRVSRLISTLGQAVDRPFRRVAKNTIRDLESYMKQAGIDGNFAAAGKYLTRSLLAVGNFFRQGDLESVLLRIAHAQSYRGPKRLELLTGARTRLLAVYQALSPTDDEAKLKNNPYPRVRGHVSDALFIWECDDELDIEGIKESVEEAKDAL